MNDNLDESTILFTVEMQSSSKDVQDRTNICFSKEGPDRGLSIFVIHSPYITLSMMLILTAGSMRYWWWYLNHKYFCPSTPSQIQNWHLHYPLAIVFAEFWWSSSTQHRPDLTGRFTSSHQFRGMWSSGCPYEIRRQLNHFISVFACFANLGVKCSVIHSG